MTPEVQEWLVWVAVLTTVLLFARSLYRRFGPGAKRSGCGSACGCGRENASLKRGKPPTP